MRKWTGILWIDFYLSIPKPALRWYGGTAVSAQFLKWNAFAHKVQTYVLFYVKKSSDSRVS